MMTAPASENTLEKLAEQIAETVREHPSVERLDGGEFGVVATHFPGRRVTGVRMGPPIEVAVVLHVDRPLPDVVDELRTRVQGLAGEVPVNLTISDVHSGT